MDLLSSSSALIYGDITQVNFSTIQNVLFVNTAAQSLIQYVKTDDTFAILYDNTSTTDEVMQCFRAWFPNAADSSLNRIGFAFHYSGTTGQDSVIPFMNQQPLFTDSDLGDSSVATFSPNTQFMLDLLLEFRTVTHLDFLACGTLLNEKCKQYYNLLQSKTDVVIGASDDNTGNIRYGGDWVMESTHEDIECIYFTAAITNWASLLTIITTYTTLNKYYHTFYTMSAATPTILTRTIYDNVGTLQNTQDISFGGMTIASVLSLLDGGAGTNPYTIGTIDASANRICMDLAYCNVYTQALTTNTQKTLLMNNVNTTYNEPHTAATTTYIVTVSGGAFWLAANGRNLGANCSLLLTYGNMYVFDQSDFSNNGYPLTINTVINNTVQFTNGVVRNGTPGSKNAYTLIDLSNSTTQTSLYYGLQGTTGGILYTSTGTGMVMGNISSVEVSSSFVASFYSSLPAGTDVSYSITGCTAANLGISSLNGTFSSPYQAVTYTVASGGGSTIAISVSGGTIPANVYINRRIADVTGILFNVKYSASQNKMVDNISSTTVTQQTGGYYLLFATGISGSSGYTVYNNLPSSATGFTTFMVLKFPSTIGYNKYFFQQSSNSAGTQLNGANMYTASLPSLIGLTMGINDFDTCANATVVLKDTPIILTMQYGGSSLALKSRINGSIYINFTGTRTLYTSLCYQSSNLTQRYFVFGNNNVEIAESIVCSNFLSDTDISFVEHKLATTYNITLPN